MLVLDLAKNFFSNILKGNDTGSTAELIHNYCNVILMPCKSGHDIQDACDFRHIMNRYDHGFDIFLAVEQALVMHITKYVIYIAIGDQYA